MPSILLRQNETIISSQIGVQYIGYTRSPLSISFKANLPAKPLLWISLFIHIEIQLELITTTKISLTLILTPNTLACGKKKHFSAQREWNCCVIFWTCALAFKDVFFPLRDAFSWDKLPLALILWQLFAISFAFFESTKKSSVHVPTSLIMNVFYLLSTSSGYCFSKQCLNPRLLNVYINNLYQEPIRRSLHLPYKPLEPNLSRADL